MLVVLRALGLGDLLTGLPALRALTEAFPEHHRVLLAPAPLSPLALFSGAVDEVLPVADLGAPTPPVEGAAVAVNLHGRGPESTRMLVASRPCRLISFCSPLVPESAAGPAWSDDVHEVVRWCGLLAAHGIAADPDRLDLQPPPVPVPAWTTGATVIHPGAASGARRWPVPRFASVARAERDVGQEVVVTGGRSERSLATAVARLAGLPIDRVLAGRTDLLELAAVVGHAARVVTGDTGVAHLATAMGTPSVILFGPTSPAQWGPPPGRTRHRILWAGSTGDPHGETVDPGLLAISVEDVLSVLGQLPRR